MILFLAARPVTAPPVRPARPVRPAPRRTRLRTRFRPLSPYRRIFAVPGTRAFTAANLVARLPMGMLSVSAVLMIAGTRGSYALAGAVTASGLAATALAGPWTARLVDRHGQARVAVPATALAVLGSLALLLCVHYGAPDWTLFACYAATATTPNTGGLSRARWAHLFRDDPAARHTANSFEQAADELCFLLGPVLATLLCTTVVPEAGTAVAAALLLTGMLLFAAQRRTEPPVAPAPATGRTRSPLRLPGLPPLLATFLATGAVFGSLEVVTIAFADGHGLRSAAGGLLALQAAGSCAAGLLYGLLRQTDQARHRFLGCTAAMAALMLLPLLAATTGGPAPLAVALLLAGMATAPTMVTGMGLVQSLTPPGRLNEGMTLAVTALLGGIAAGSAGGGWAADHLGGAGAAYGVPAAAAALAAAVTLLTARKRPRPRRPGTAGPGPHMG
ncbi:MULTISPECIES: MFS transporter [unclassified Streptomyces]|uniref:MFS transporter n=1 Tax=unclassified Streptomyces TaxID=2593676 RepID=UPI00088516BA|nr:MULTISPECIES: MFS transporter [unclassified Streptomyces]PBC82701.1 MFS transporter [Streptomyces sp. 2321.6]SDR47853.1 Major Facilitator Superfamily protein [Streptomyces sp. KS_16]SEC68297.1 Major Facilitator Superfamily protein [Streptomyces sp. 2133.1]SEE93615.1 Major Facilitator Superfamily protein [Streptomyces sp. 2112.3]SNC68777.1 Major Facilitator Superfamily protein [Streptomyces sp. 2114.4]